MLEQLIGIENFIFYILAGELFVGVLFQMRTNHLLKKSLKLRTKKREQLKTFKEEVKDGTSEIPIVKFEKNPKNVPVIKKAEKKGGYDPKEMAVLQEMMSEFFG